MDITAETVREAQFRQAWKGYDTAEVDDFLDAVASGIGSLQSKVGELTERIVSAEDRALRAEARPSLRSEPDESVRRTLVLAQRAADLVVSEAKAVADRIVADSRDQAARIVTASQEAALRAQAVANAQAEQLLSGAEAEADRMISVRAAELQSSLSLLVDEQARRRLELEHLGLLISDTKAQWRSVLAGQLTQLGDDEARVTNNIERQVDEALSTVISVESTS